MQVPDVAATETSRIPNTKGFMVVDYCLQYCWFAKIMSAYILFAILIIYSSELIRLKYLRFIQMMAYRCDAMRCDAMRCDAIRSKISI